MLNIPLRFNYFGLTKIKFLSPVWQTPIPLTLPEVACTR